jgi:hypothetical protein
MTIPELIANLHIIHEEIQKQRIAEEENRQPFSTWQMLLDAEYNALVSAELLEEVNQRRVNQRRAKQ